jgi:hypothetical protein
MLWAGLSPGVAVSSRVDMYFVCAGAREAVSQVTLLPRRNVSFSLGDEAAGTQATQVIGGGNVTALRGAVQGAGSVGSVVVHVHVC